MTGRSSSKRIRCPCEENCPQARPRAVNTVLRNKAILSNDLKRELKRKVGEGAARRGLRFLHHVETDEKGEKRNVLGCKHVGVRLRVDERQIENEDNIVHFNGRNRFFFSRLAKSAQIQSKIRKLLPTVQRWLLKSFEKEHFGTYYLSSYELRKSTPYPADHLSFSLGRLLDLGFLKEVKVDVWKIHKPAPRVMRISEIINGLKDGSLKKSLELPSKYEMSFYTTPKREKYFADFKQSAIKEELIEHEIVKQVYMRIIQKYRRDLELYGMRTRDPRLLKLAKGYSFDIFCSFRRRQFREKRLLGVDVYTRLSLSEAIVRIFAKKIKSTGCSGRIYTRECQSSGVPQLCKKHRIHLIYLKNTTIDYRKICQKIETKLNSANL